MVSTDLIIQNAISQFEAQKKKAYQDAYDVKYNELKADYDVYVCEKQKEKAEAIGAINDAFTKTCEAKRFEIEGIANSYAEVQVTKLDGQINELKKLLSTN